MKTFFYLTRVRILVEKINTTKNEIGKLLAKNVGDDDAFVYIKLWNDNPIRNTHFTNFTEIPLNLKNFVFCHFLFYIR